MLNPYTTLEHPRAVNTRNLYKPAAPRKRDHKPRLSPPRQLFIAHRFHTKAHFPLVYLYICIYIRTRGLYTYRCKSRVSPRCSAATKGANERGPPATIYIYTVAERRTPLSRGLELRRGGSINQVRECRVIARSRRFCGLFIIAQVGEYIYIYIHEARCRWLITVLQPGIEMCTDVLY